MRNLITTCQNLASKLQKGSRYQIFAFQLRIRASNSSKTPTTITTAWSIHKVAKPRRKRPREVVKARVISTVRLSTIQMLITRTSFGIKRERQRLPI
jgi:hypothetical protein